MIDPGTPVSPRPSISSPNGTILKYPFVNSYPVIQLSSYLSMCQCLNIQFSDPRFPPANLASPAHNYVHTWAPDDNFRKVKFSTISRLTTHVPLSNHLQKPQGDCVPLSLAHNSPPAHLESLMTDPYLKNSSDSSDKEKNFYASRSKSQDSIFSSSFGNFHVSPPFYFNVAFIFETCKEWI